jgi:hypothetical protein
VAALKEGKLTIKHEAVKLSQAISHVMDILGPLAKKEVRGRAWPGNMQTMCQGAAIYSITCDTGNALHRLNWSRTLTHQPRSSWPTMGALCRCVMGADDHTITDTMTESHIGNQRNQGCHQRHGHCTDPVQPDRQLSQVHDARARSSVRGSSEAQWSGRS